MKTTNIGPNENGDAMWRIEEPVKYKPIESIMTFLALHDDEISNYDLNANKDGFDLKVSFKKNMEGTE